MITRDAYVSVGGVRYIPRNEDLELGITTYLMYPAGISLVSGVTVEVSGRRIRDQYDVNYEHVYRHGKMINI